MSNAFTFTSKNYSIVTSLNERTIYLKITDNVLGSNSISNTYISQISSGKAYIDGYPVNKIRQEIINIRKKMSKYVQESKRELQAYI